MTITGADQALSLPLPRPNPLRPAPVLARLRAERPVCPVTASTGEPAWLVTRYRDARTVLTDPRFRMAFPGVPDGAGEMNDSLLQDPPGHTRLRRLVSAAFTPRRVASLRPGIERLTDGIIDRMIARGAPADLMEALALPVPITVIGELLGVPERDRDRFRDWADALMSLSTTDPGTGWQELSVHLGELIAAKRADPGEDLLSALVAVRDADADRLGEAELQTLAITLIAAGYVTTSVATGVGVVLLTGHGQLARLRDDPSLVPGAVEEVLRYQASAGEVARTAGEDLELGGTAIRAGEKVVVSLTAVNRDPDRFADPDRFDIARADNGHLTFGHGIHHCLGASLARVELQAIVTCLAARLPGLRLAIDVDDLTWQRSELFGDEWPRTVPVSW